MKAVVFDRYRYVVFSDDVPAEHLPEIRDRMGGRIIDDVSLEVPEDLNDWSEGTEAPQAVLCVDRADPRHFRVFKFAREVDAGRYEPTDFSYMTVDDWRRFLDAFRSLEEIASITEEGETAETWDELLRSIDSHRSPGNRLFEGIR